MRKTRCDCHAARLPEYIAEYSQDPNGCWPWRGSTNSQGYGVLYWGGRRDRRAHRIVYEYVVGPIPDGLELDHLCRNRACVNPAHLEPVTHAENIRRSPGNGLNKRTHCKRGHPFDADNTAYHRRRGYTERVCRACFRMHSETHMKKVGRWKEFPRGGTCCPRGHEYTPENTYYRRTEGNARRCRMCRRAREGTVTPRK